MNFSKKLVALVVVIVAVGAGSAAFASIPDGGGVIHACYMKSGGSIRVIDATVTNCKATETSLDWNRVASPACLGRRAFPAPRAPKGETGDAGPQGIAGPQGPKGDTGATGATAAGAEGRHGFRRPEDDRRLVSDTGALQVGSGVTASKAARATMS